MSARVDNGFMTKTMSLVRKDALVEARARPPHRGRRTHDEIVMEIARLDLQHEAGELPTDEWERRRAELRSRAEDRRAGVPG